MFHRGDVPASSTQYFFFDSYDSNGASVTITGLATTDIEIYKNGSVTQRASDNGYALLDTDGIDFDATTGLHGFSVDLSDNSDSGFYSAGGSYVLNVNAVTIDSQTVRFSYEFTIGLDLRPTTAGRTLDVSSGGEAGLDWANVGSPTTTVGLSGTSVKIGNYAGQGGATATVEWGGGNASVPSFYVHNDIADGIGMWVEGDSVGFYCVSDNHAIDVDGDLAVTGTVIMNALTASGTIDFQGAVLASHASNSINLGTDAIGSTQLAATATSEIGTAVWATATRTLTANTNLSILTAAQIATGVWTDTTAGDFTTALSIGKSVMNGVALGTGLTINAYTGDTPQTGDSFARIGAAGAGLTAVDDATLAAIAALNNLSSAQVTAAVPTAASVATAVWGFAISTGHTAAQYMRNIGAVLLGKSSGLTAGAGTVVYRDVTDATNQVTGTVTSDGNRTSTTPGA